VQPIFRVVPFPARRGQSGPSLLPFPCPLEIRRLRAVTLLACALTLDLPLAIGAERQSTTAFPAHKPAKNLGPPTQGSDSRVETVTFVNGQSKPVIVVRGGRPEDSFEAGRTNLPELPTAIKILTFGDQVSRSVRTLKPGGDQPGAVRSDSQISERPSGVTDRTIETVRFIDSRFQPVTVIKGSVFEPPAAELFSPATERDLDRIAFAVEGAESAHGTDPRMWRPEPNGPQGPMQVSLAAAMDVGGGNRFAEGENRALGRAYLDRLYRRYGNWPDAIAAYNWGPGKMDGWISAGRPVDKFPLEVERYRNYVLRHAALSEASAAPSAQ
jgi:hypothetical protein